MAKKTSPKDRASRQAKMAPKGNKRMNAQETRPARGPGAAPAERDETGPVYSEG
ncbi:hypothetical protein ACN9M0_35145 [Streptomyces sp. R-07]|uniref:hypothetical protein n=1 Tax=Streptomyces sp. R-07 TaxID=3404052 RepID=UPI003CF67D86